MIGVRVIISLLMVLVIGGGIWISGCCRDNNDADCSGEQVCNMGMAVGNTGTCREPGTIDVPCMEDVDCLGPYACDLGMAGRCKVPLGEACENNEDCFGFEANSCLQGVCSERGWSCDLADHHDCREDAACFCYGPIPCMCYMKEDE